MSAWIDSESKVSDLLLSTAKEIFESEPHDDLDMCRALIRTSTNASVTTFKKAQANINMFEPEDQYLRVTAYWGRCWGWEKDGAGFHKNNYQRVRECRVLALCFAAAMEDTL